MIPAQWIKGSRNAAATAWVWPRSFCMPRVWLEKEGKKKKGRKEDKRKKKREERRKGENRDRGREGGILCRCLFLLIRCYSEI